MLLVVNITSYYYNDDYDEEKVWGLSSGQLLCSYPDPVFTASPGRAGIQTSDLLVIKDDDEEEEEEDHDEDNDNDRDDDDCN